MAPLAEDAPKWDIRGKIKVSFSDGGGGGRGSVDCHRVHFLFFLVMFRTLCVLTERQSVPRPVYMRNAQSNQCTDVARISRCAHNNVEEDHVITIMS